MLRKRLFFIVVLLAALNGGAQDIYDSVLFESRVHIDGNDTMPFLLYRSTGCENQGVTPALVLFLHGAGERGSDNRQQLRHCVRFFMDDTVSRRYPFILLLPQCPENERWVNTDWRLPCHAMEANPTRQMMDVMDIVDSLKNNGAIDSNRVYICGISMGGFGVWDALQRYPGRFAAAIAVCGGGDPAYSGRIKHTPLYIFHGDRDKLVLPIRSRQMYLALRKSHSRDLHYIHYADLGHLCWDRAFSTPGLFHWLFSRTSDGQRKK